jgi:hypothetical protein
MVAQRLAFHDFDRRQNRDAAALPGLPRFTRQPGSRGTIAGGRPGLSPLALRARALQATNRGEAVPRLVRFGVPVSEPGRHSGGCMHEPLSLRAGQVR